MKKNRAGELAQGSLPWGIRFLGLSGRGVVPARGAEPTQKPGGEAGPGVKWSRGGGSGARSGADLKLQNAT